VEIQLHAQLIFQLDGSEQSNYIQGESTVVHNGYKSGET